VVCSCRRIRAMWAEERPLARVRSHVNRQRRGTDKHLAALAAAVLLLALHPFFINRVCCFRLVCCFSHDGASVFSFLQLTTTTTMSSIMALVVLAAFLPVALAQGLRACWSPTTFPRFANCANVTTEVGQALFDSPCWLL
jgi:hypothetical protein